jgi:hypothetical protein
MLSGHPGLLDDASEMDERRVYAPRGTTRLLTAAIAAARARAASARANRL